MIEVTVPCVEYIGTRTRQGYGMVYEDGRQWLAHRLAWTRAYGPIPKGQCVLHACDNPSCIEWRHLFLGTKADNAADRDRKGRTARGERQGKARLTTDSVRQLRADHVAGVAIRELARRVGVAPITVRRAITGQNWGHV